MFKPFRELLNISLVNKYGKTTGSLLVTGISLIDSLLSMVVFIGIAYIVETSLQGKSPSLTNIFKFSFSRLSDFFGTGLLFSIIILPLTLLLIIPGIIWSNYYSFAFCIVALRGMKGKAALDYSKRIIQGQWLRIFGIHLMLSLASIIIDLPTLIISRKLPDIKFLNAFIPFTIFNIVLAILTVMSIVLFLNTENIKNIQKQNRVVK